MGHATRTPAKTKAHVEGLEAADVRTAEVRGRAARRGLMRELEAATGALHAAAARAFGRGALDREAVREIRALLKSGARARVGADDALRIVAAQFRARAAELSAAAEQVAAANDRRTSGGGGGGPVQVIEHEVGHEAGYESAGSEAGGAPPHAESGAPAPRVRPAARRRGRRRAAGPILDVVGAAPAPRARLLSEADDAELAMRAMRAPLVRLMRHGASAAQALARLGLSVTPTSRRWAQRVYRAYATTGVVHDRRADRTNPAPVMTGPMRHRVLKHWLSRPRISAKTVRRLVELELQQECAHAQSVGIRFHAPALPDKSTVAKFLRRLPEPVRLMRGKGIAAWDKQGAPKAVYEPALHGNHYWQIDHSQLDIMLRLLVGTTWVVVRPWITVVLDVYSRAIAAVVLSIRAPDAFTTAHALRKAMLPKDDPRWPIQGKPVFLTPDHGRDFESHAVGLTTRALGITLDFCPPHYPDMKAEVERVIRTIKESLCSRFPGDTLSDGSSAASVDRRVMTLLTVRQFRRELECWVVEEYNSVPHSETRRAPSDLWRESTPVLEMPNRHDLDVYLLKADTTRRVKSRGILFTPPGAPLGRYWAPELAVQWRREVRLRYNPDDLESVLVYDVVTGRLICEAWRVGEPDSRYTHQHIVEARRELRGKLRHLDRLGRRTLVERMADYYAEADEEARAASERTGGAWEEARAVIDELVTRGERRRERSSSTRAPGDRVGHGAEGHQRHPTATARRASAAVAAPAAATPSTGVASPAAVGIIASASARVTPERRTSPPVQDTADTPPVATVVAVESVRPGPASAGRPATAPRRPTRESSPAAPDAPTALDALLRQLRSSA